MKYDLAAIARQAGRRGTVDLPRHHVPPGSEAALRRALNAMLKEMAGYTRDYVLPVAGAERAMMQDNAGDRLEASFGAMREAFTRFEAIAGELVRRLLRLQADQHTKTFRRAVKRRLGIDLSAVVVDADADGLLSLALSRNTSLIRSISQDMAKRIEQAILVNVTEGRSAKALRDELTNSFGIGQRRARNIARDQTSKFHSSLTKLRQTQADVVLYRWSTSRDEKVRRSHARNEGKLIRWDSPPSETGHPGEDPLCRCTAIAVVEI